MYERDEFGLPTGELVEPTRAHGTIASSTPSPIVLHYDRPDRPAGHRASGIATTWSCTTSPTTPRASSRSPAHPTRSTCGPTSSVRWHPRAHHDPSPGDPGSRRHWAGRRLALPGGNGAPIASLGCRKPVSILMPRSRSRTSPTAASPTSAARACTPATSPRPSPISATPSRCSAASRTRSSTTASRSRNCRASTRSTTTSPAGSPDSGSSRPAKTCSRWLRS